MKLFVATVLCFFVVYQAAEIIQHGFDPLFWPETSISPSQWFDKLTFHVDFYQLIDRYIEVLFAQSQNFSNKGWSPAPLLAFVPLFMAILGSVRAWVVQLSGMDDPV